MSTFTYDHIHIRSRDPENTAAYFERMFEAQIIRTMQEGKQRIDMKIGGQDRARAPIESNSKVNAPPVPASAGLDRGRLRVKDIDKVVAGGKAKGAEFTMEQPSSRRGLRPGF